MKGTYMLSPNIHWSLSRNISYKMTNSYLSTSHHLLKKLIQCSFCNQCRRSSSSSSNITSAEFTIYAPESGHVEGVWIFHRHGDRTPARSLVPPHHFEAEKEFWTRKIPPGMSIYETLSRTFPAQIHESNNQGQFFDVHGGKEPYGFLTYRGMEQMRLLGRRLASRYSTETNMLDHWDIQAYSTNYLRTVKSAQCFLHGLLQQDKDLHTFYEQQHFAGDEHYVGPTIQVRERSQDILNAFDRQPQLMKRLVQDVVTKDSFTSQDEKLFPLAQRLTSFLPGLAKAANYGGPSGINWIHASDHFVCRESHNLQLTHYSMFHNDEQAENLIASLKSATLSHLAWRFRQWYQNPSLLAAIVLAPLREIETQMKMVINLEGQDRKPFVIYSCHDVTLLSLLYGIGADFVASEGELKEAGISVRRSDGEERWKYWPEYATSLVFELIRVHNEHYVRILLNGQQVRLITHVRKHETTLKEFSDIILEVENKSHICAKIEDDHNARDMSTWTG